jgi:cell wall-associated NlpC family hydrolase
MIPNYLKLFCFFWATSTISTEILSHKDMPSASCVPFANTFIPIDCESRWPQCAIQLLKKAPISRIPNIISNFDALRCKWIKSWETEKLCLTAAQLAQDFIPNVDDFFQENLLPFQGNHWLTPVIDNANFNQLNTLKKPAVMLKHASLRKLPTNRPIYSKVTPDLEGIPFDRLQNSFINACTPVYVSHFSKDRAWAFIENSESIAVGFVPSNSVAMIDDNSMKKVQAQPIGVFSQDGQPLYDEKGLFLEYSRLGMVMFVKKENKKTAEVFWPMRNRCGYTEWRTICVPKSIFHCQPMAFSTQTVQHLLSQFLGKNYGWGGLYGLRDCSSLVQDYFRLLGTALPRNSKGQIMSGPTVDLSAMSPAEKEKTVIQRGIPYRTILYAPGHIALYVGVINRRAIIVHARFGVGIACQGTKGTNVVGKCIASRLDFGSEIPNAIQENIFLNKLSGMLTPL